MFFLLYLTDCGSRSLKVQENLGRDIFTLPEMLGHGRLDTVRQWVQVTQVDLEQAHRKASPADN